MVDGRVEGGGLPPRVSMVEQRRRGGAYPDTHLVPRRVKQGRFEAPTDLQRVRRGGNLDCLPQRRSKQHRTGTSSGTNYSRTGPSSVAKKIGLFALLSASSCSSLRSPRNSNDIGRFRRASAPVAAIRAGGGVASCLGGINCAGGGCAFARSFPPGSFGRCSPQDLCPELFGAGR